MKYDSAIHHRRSIRLRGHDYAQDGFYFVTICCHQRQPLFGEIAEGKMMLNAAGGIVNTVWRELPNHYPGITLGEYVVMPNHFHGIIHIVGAQFIAPEFSTTHQGVIKQGALKQGTLKQGTLKQGAMNRAPTVGNIIRAFKARCTYAINTINESAGAPIWQRNYYEHVIRNEESYLKIAEYIQTNPLRWQNDRYYL